MICQNYTTTQGIQRHLLALKQSENALELYPAQPILYLLNGVSNINLNAPKKAIDSLETGLDFLVENPVMKRDFYTQPTLMREHGH